MKWLKFAKMRSPARSNGSSEMQVLPIIRDGCTNKETWPSQPAGRKMPEDHSKGRNMLVDQPADQQTGENISIIPPRQDQNPMQSSWAEERERELAQAAMQGRCNRDGRSKGKLPSKLDITCESGKQTGLQEAED